MERIDAGEGGARLRIRAELASEPARGRLDRGRGLLPHGRRGRRRRVRGRRDEPDPLADHARARSSRRPRSTSSRRCAPASRSAATSSRATSTASARWRSVSEDGIARRLVVRLPDGLERYAVEHGSIAIAGVSLTVSGLDDDAGVEVSLIPETLERTTLGSAVRRRLASTSSSTSIARHVERLLHFNRGRNDLMAETQTQTPFATIEEAIEDIRAGRMVVVCDDENRENEGDLTLAAQFATPEAVNFMAKEGRGLICLALTGERCERARPQPDGGEERGAAADRVHGLGRGSPRRHHRDLGGRPRAHDPGRDRRQLGARGPGPARPRVPAARPRRAACSSAPGRPRPRSIWLASPASTRPGVICEIMNDDGTMARVNDLVPYCERHGLKMITVADLIAYRRRTERLVERVVATGLPTAFGEFTAIGYRSLARRQAPRGDGQGRRRGRRGRPRPRPLRVPHRRRLPLAALRLRRAARGGDGDDRERGPRRPPLPLPGGPRDRAAEQAPRLQAPGGGARHGRREPEARAARPTCATTGSAPRSSSTSASRASASSPTTRRRSTGSRATASRSPSRCRSSRCPTRTTRST